MKIRLLDPRDAEAYYQLRLEALRDSPHAFAASFEEEKKQSAKKYEERFRSGDSYNFGAFIHNELVGVVTLVKEKREKLKHRATLVAMYVTPDHRGKGIGKSLVLEALKKAKDIKEIEQVYLSVVSNNEVAIRLYSSLGFETYGVEERALKVEGDYFDEKHMVLFLR